MDTSPAMLNRTRTASAPIIRKVSIVFLLAPADKAMPMPIRRACIFRGINREGNRHSIPTVARRRHLSPPGDTSGDYPIQISADSRYLKGDLNHLSPQSLIFSAGALPAKHKSQITQFFSITELLSATHPLRPLQLRNSDRPISRAHPQRLSAAIQLPPH